MSDSEVRRSLRRGVALLLLPLSGAASLPAIVESTLPGIADALGVLLFTVAVLYLVSSGVRQLSAAADTPF